MPKLVISTQRGDPTEIRLGSLALTIGREPENGIQLDWPDVSRRHCRIEPLPDGGYRLVDLKSKNGTFLNGRQVTAMALELDDHIRLGEATVLFVADDADPKAALERVRENILPWGAPSPDPDRVKSVNDSWEAVLSATPVSGHPHLPGPHGPDEEVTDDGVTWRSAGRSQFTSAPTGRQGRQTNRTYLKDRLLRLGMLSQNIASQLDLSRLLDTILDEVLDFTGFERGLLLMSGEDGGPFKPVLGRNMDHGKLAEGDRAFSRSLLEEVIKGGRLVIREGLTGHVDAHSSAVSMGLQSAMCIPLKGSMRFVTKGVREERRRGKSRKRFLGVIYLDSTFPIRPLDDADKQLLEAVAAQAAIALQNARLYHQASTDPMTKLANRGYMKQIFEEELRYARDEKEPVGVLILDLDKFKRINDTHGHNVGDEVLKRVAQRIQRTIRRDDHAGRWGGEEFVVLLPGEGLEGTLIVAEKIADAIRSQPFSEKQIRVTASIGVSIFPEHGQEPGILVKHADQALYAAKAAGRNRTEVFRAELDRADHRTDPLSGIFEEDPAHTHRSLGIVFDTIDALRSAKGPQEILNHTLDNVCDLTRARRSLLIYRAKDGNLQVAVARARSGRQLPDGQEFSNSAVNTALSEARAVCVLDALDQRGQILSSSSIDRLGLNTVMCVPLVAGEATFGVLYADDTTAKREFTQMDLSHLEVMAHQLSLTLAANPRAYARLLPCEATLGALDETQRLRDEVERLREQVRRLGGPV
jgi:diguanylate cyclase (GGDEF)-like protein